ncbi:MAG: methyltransferase domain-containing protein [Candidatus Omnitrophica bacterium]|nr:methyltransferase domain-containing protein [Candidatus Omnitrophota bacterium]
MMSRVKTARYFSDAAALYESRAHIQRALAVELAGRVRVRPGAVVADIGTGTGMLLKELNQKYPEAVYVGLDASEGMLKHCPALRVCADYQRLPFRRECLDLLVSSSCYHWSQDLQGAFGSAGEVIKPGGKLEVVLFGRDTLVELFKSLAAVSPGVSSRLDAMARLPALEDVCAALGQAGFTAFDFEREIRRETFASLVDVLLWLKDTGTNGLGRGMFLGRDALDRAEVYFQKTYHRQVSFEVIWLQAQK